MGSNRSSWELTTQFVWSQMLWVWYFIGWLFCFRDGNVQISRQGTFTLQANEVYILQSFVRTWIDLLELRMSRDEVLLFLACWWLHRDWLDLENKNLVKERNAGFFDAMSLPCKSKKGDWFVAIKKKIRIIIIANLSSGHFVRGTRVNNKMV